MSRRNSIYHGYFTGKHSDVNQLQFKKDENSPNRRLLLRRKMAVASVVVVTFLFLLFYNLGSYLFIKKMGRHLENALDGRLKTGAGMAAEIIERDLNDLNDPSETSLTRLLLSQIRLENDLEAAYIINPHFEVLVDSRFDLEMGVSRGYLREDSTAIFLAERGSVTTSALHTVAGNHFKNSYALIQDVIGNRAILVLEANADFMDAISFFHRGLYLGMLTSLLLLFLLTLFLIGATSLFLKTEARLQQSQRLAAMGQMAATVAHEIRNPLGIIKSTADLLQERSQSDSNSTELFGYINDEIRRLNGLVGDFLSLTKEPAMNLAENDLCKVIGEAVHLFQPKHTSKIDLVLLPDQAPLMVRCDADLIRQVVINLLINAAQSADDDGRICVKVESEKSRGRRFVRVQVIDEGSGIEGDPSAIFEPFYTTKAQGTGLGLAVSRNIIERHGGDIEAANRAEGGAMLTFSLPALSNRRVNKSISD
jgi:signal transduction histidine kinase